MRRTVRRIVRPALHELDFRAIHDNPFVSAKLYPLADPSAEYIQPYPDEPPHEGEEFSVPPFEFWQGYAQTPEEFLACGRSDLAAMLGILSRAGTSAEELTRVLDFGCGAGRMLRFYPRFEGKSELWGVDVNAELINWCQLNMSAPFSFVTTTTAPHLPFEDNYFDLVYSGSVFTHISDLADAWFLEVRRVVRKGGYLYITIHDRRTVELLLTRFKDHPLFLDFVPMVEDFCKRTGVRSKPYAYFSMLTEPVAQVFYDEEYLLEKWSRWAEVVSVTPEAHDHQTALLLRKRT
jgi:ubiquinone/menaquinone biosynthesis C-methylase UbiE